MNQDLQDERIRAYLKGRLSTEEKTAFEAQLQQDAGLTERLALLRADMAAAELLIAENTRALFEQWRQERPNKGAFWRRPPFWYATFVLMAVLALGAWWLYTAKEPEPPVRRPLQEQTPPVQEEKQSIPVAPPATAPAPPARRPKNTDYIALADRYFQEPVQPTVRRSVADTVQSPLRLAQEAYGQGRYEEALELLAQVDSTRRQSATYWQAHTLFHLRRFEEAKRAFESLVQENSRQYRYASEWGMLMCRMAQGKSRQEEFRQQLEDILLQSAHPYREMARQLNDQLE